MDNYSAKRFRFPDPHLAVIVIPVIFHTSFSFSKENDIPLLKSIYDPKIYLDVHEMLENRLYKWQWIDLAIQ
ncbi:hypothetical protein ABC255_28635 [Neobacillus sp. 3P2-tot-E-2]|uniref:hypothetical protein n=1 Tax=Neobacillus sp. 3P2-tot-E-2 TaxID=3132212 RepID=UPI0039A3C675